MPPPPPSPRLCLLQVPGWPLWEPGVFSLLRRCFASALVPMYVRYCRCLTHSCDSARRANSLGLEEWMCLVTDCNVRHAAFEASRNPRPADSSPRLLLTHACPAPLYRNRQVPARGFELRKLHRLHGACVAPGAAEQTLRLPQFLTALVRLAYQRANHVWLEAPERPSHAPGATPPRPLPGCLATLLDDHILKHGQRSEAGPLLGGLLRGDEGVRRALSAAEESGELRAIYDALQPRTAAEAAELAEAMRAYDESDGDADEERRRTGEAARGEAQIERAVVLKTAAEVREGEAGALNALLSKPVEGVCLAAVLRLLRDARQVMMPPPSPSNASRSLHPAHLASLRARSLPA